MVHLVVVYRKSALTGLFGTYIKVNVFTYDPTIRYHHKKAFCAHIEDENSLRALNPTPTINIDRQKPYDIDMCVSTFVSGCESQQHVVAIGL